MGLPTGAEGRDSSKGEDSAEEAEAKPAVVAPPPVVEASSTPSAAFPSDATAEVRAWWALGVAARAGQAAFICRTPSKPSASGPPREQVIASGAWSSANRKHFCSS
jgi:hypothetical protein